ncbi:MAG: hypothetical protein P4L31_01760 [Candidatus Babeliales bacterium]|nr:hypothetical protein [Candidatus Babeliales bacterium]
MKKNSLLLLMPIIFCSLSSAMHELSTEYAKNLQTSPQTLKSLKKRKICQTDLTNQTIRSSNNSRTLLFEALHNCGHIQPEVVMLTSDPNNFSACAHQNETHGVYVNFDEKSEWTRQSYGTQRMVMHHEAAHIVRGHYNNTTNTSHQNQNDERDADRIAAIKGKCTQCAREFADYFLAQYTKEHHENELLKKHQNITLADIEDMPKKNKTTLIQKTYLISKKQKKEHPIHLERALRLHTISVALGDALCPQHKNLVDGE